MVLKYAEAQSWTLILEYSETVLALLCNLIDIKVIVIKIFEVFR